ncbi:MAG: hypothetical protein IJF29_02840 [Firmicutes bacterium]|nr:hypothetical protein [Bacillota bacterium]
MKRNTVILFLAVICSSMFTACAKNDVTTENENLTVYSFCGETEEFVLSEGVIVFDGNEEIYYGGNIKSKEGQLDDITAYTMTLYISTDGEKNVLLSNSVVDETGGTINIDGEVGRISGDIWLKEHFEKDDTLCFELEATRIGGEKYICQIAPDVVEITK